MKNKELKNRLIISLLLIALTLLIFVYSYFLAFTLFIFSIISIIEFKYMIKKIFKQKIILRYVSLLLFIIYLIFFSFYFFIMCYGGINEKLYLFGLLLICIFSDVGGLLFGKLFKGPKLTKISPNKTISGSIGSFLCSLIFFLIFVRFLQLEITLPLILICLFTSLGCQIGDICFSFLKRKARVKDTGKLLPGHGGILDRIDGILLGIPFGLIIINIF